MKIMIVEDEDVLRELLICMVEMELNCDVLDASGGFQAIELLKKETDIDVILSDHDMPEGTGKDLYEYVQEKHSEIAFNLITARSLKELEGFENLTKDNPNNAYYCKPFDQEILLKNLLTLASKKKPTTTSVAYHHLHLSSLALFPTIDSDVYLKISETKYVKVYHAKDTIEKSKIESYRKKGVTGIYIPSGSFKSVMGSMKEVLKKQLDNANLTMAQQIKAQSSALSHMSNLIGELELNEQLVETVNETTTSVMANLKKDPSLAKLMASMSKEGEYLHQHSLMISYISCMIAEKQAWQNEQTFEKLCTASYLHDSNFEDSELAKEHDQIGLDISKLSNEKQKLYYDHPSIISNIVSQVPKLSSDIDNILLFHHERPDGHGYPRKIPAPQIPPMACTFILAEVFVVSYLNMKNGEGNMEELKTYLGTNYNKGNFRKPYQALLEVLKNR